MQNSYRLDFRVHRNSRKQFKGNLDVSVLKQCLLNSEFDYIPESVEEFEYNLKTNLGLGDFKYLKGVNSACDTLIIENWTDGCMCMEELSEENRHLGRFKYVTRDDTGLPLPCYKLYDDGTIGRRNIGVGWLHIDIFNNKYADNDIYTNWYIINVRIMNTCKNTGPNPMNLLNEYIKGISFNLNPSFYRGLYLDSVDYYRNNVGVVLDESLIDELIEFDKYCLPEYLDDLYKEIAFKMDWLLKTDEEKRHDLDIELDDISRDKISLYLTNASSKGTQGSFIEDETGSDLCSSEDMDGLDWNPVNWMNSTHGLVKRDEGGGGNQLFHTFIDLEERFLIQ
jgi:hypothetical protein